MRLLTKFLEDRGIYEEFLYNFTGYADKGPYQSAYREEGAEYLLRQLYIIYQGHTIMYCINMCHPETRDCHFWKALNEDFINYYYEINRDLEI